MKICSKCLSAPARPGQKWCVKCHAEHMRDWRKTHPLSTQQRMKNNARSYLHVYVKRGLVTKLKCESCGNPNSEAHHHDYSKPLEVVWLCRACHLHIHRIGRAA